MEENSREAMDIIDGSKAHRDAFYRSDYLPSNEEHLNKEPLNDIYEKATDKTKIYYSQFREILLLFKIVKDKNINCNLPKFFDNVCLIKIDLSHIDLSGLTLQKANLQEADLFKSNLQNCNLAGIKCYATQLTDSNLEDSKLDSAHLILGNYILN